MSSAVWWCPVCERRVEQPFDDGAWIYAGNSIMEHDGACPGIPIDLVAERKRLLAENQGLESELMAVYRSPADWYEGRLKVVQEANREFQARHGAAATVTLSEDFVKDVTE